MPATPSQAAGPHRQTVLVNFGYQVQPEPDGGVVLLVLMPGESLVLRFDPKSREQVGKAFVAPHIEVPTHTVKVNGREVAAALADLDPGDGRR